MKKIMFVNSLALLLVVGGGTVLASEVPVTESYKGSELVTENSVMTSSFISDDENHINPLVTDTEMDGGWWYRGKVSNRLVSEYKHYSKQGRGSCRNGNGTENDGGWKKKDVWSKSSVGYTLLGGNKVYYDYK